MDPEAVGKVIGEIRVEPKRGQRSAIAIVIALLLVIGGVVLWKSYMHTTSPPIDVRPAIAVLPFDNMSDDPQQEYFSDGMTDDLITDLSKVSGLFVIARNSTLVYKGKPLNIPEVAEELGVRYVLEGSVRRAGEEVRINAQLIDSTTGGHVWADRYDGRMGDIFALQDKITGQIVKALAVQLTADEERRFAVKETSSIEAYDAFLQGWQHYLSKTPEDFKKAVEYFKKAIELDPDYGRAYAALALTYWRGAGFGWARKMGTRYNVARVRAVRTMEKAMKNPTSIAHRLAAEMFVQKHKHAKAISEAQLALALDPNDAENHITMARILVYSGRPEEAIPYAKRSMLLNPRDKSVPLHRIALAHFCMGQFEEAAKLSNEALKLNPDFHPAAGVLAASYAHLGRIEEARAAMEIYYKGWGRTKPSLEMAMYWFPSKNPEHAASLAEGFLKAGMSGKPGGYYKVSDELKLKGEEITSLFFGTEIAGFVGKNREWRIGRMEQGEAKFWYRSKLIGSGKSCLEGDALCNQWDKAIGGLKYCMDVFRNPQGTPEEKNEYVILADYGIFGCSIEH
jgi:TolB-like protein